MIERWNEKYEWPKLRSANAREFPAYIEERHGDRIPVHRAAWPDWWSDGFGSAAQETAAAKKTQSPLVQLGRLNLGEFRYIVEGVLQHLCHPHSLEFTNSPHVQGFSAGKTIKNST